MISDSDTISAPEKSTERLRLLMDFTARIQADDETDAIWRDMNKTALDLSEAEAVLAGCLSSEGRFEIKAMATSGSDAAPLLARALESRAVTIFQAVERAAEPVRRYVPVGEETSIDGGTLLALPLTRPEREIIGMQVVAAVGEDIPDAAGESFLSQLAAIASLGLRNQEIFRQSREQTRAMESLLATVPAAVWIAHDPDCRSVTGNRAADMLLQCPGNCNAAGDAQRNNRPDTFEIFQAGEPAIPTELPLYTAARGQAVSGAELEIVFRNETRRHIFGNAVPLYTAEGKIKGSLGAFIDITPVKAAEKERLRAYESLEDTIEERTKDLTTTIGQLQEEVLQRLKAEQELRRSEHKYSSLVENSITGIFLLQNGRFLYANRQFATILGYDREELYRLNPLKLVHPGDRPRIRKLIQESRNNQSLPEELELRCRRKNGDTIWVQGCSAFVEYNDRPAIQVTVIDITGRRQAEQALRDLAALLLSGQEEERKYLARSIHDSVGQHLSGIKFRLEKSLTQLDHDQYETAAEGLLEIVEVIRKVIDRSYSIQSRLWPATLDELGILPTISLLADRIEESYPEISVEPRLALTEEEIPEEKKIVIYRILQEALENSARHSDSTTVRIFLEQNSSGLELRVEDDGKGIDWERQTDKPQGLGLGSMRERIKQSGGSFHIETAPGRGTTLRALWR